MKEHGELMNNTVVTTVMSNFGLYKAFDEQGIGYAKTAVGDKYVYEYMAKNGCRIGGEQSGHIIFSKYASTGDGILTSLKMMEVMLAKKMPMSKLAEPLKIYPQVLENVRVTDKKAAQNDPAVQEAVKAVLKRWAIPAVFWCVSPALSPCPRDGGGSRPRHLPEICLSGRGGHQEQGLRRLRLSAAADVARAPKCGQQTHCTARFCIFLLTNPHFCV